MPGSKRKLLPDKIYDDEIERMSGLPKFPAYYKGRQELRHALRRISETDLRLLHRLISDVMDTHTSCPTPASLMQMATSEAPAGRAGCVQRPSSARL